MKQTFKKIGAWLSALIATTGLSTGMKCNNTYIPSYLRGKVTSLTYQDKFGENPSQAPLKNANIEILENGSKIKTGCTGDYAFELNPEEYTLKVSFDESKTAYQVKGWFWKHLLPTERKVSILEGKETLEDFVLEEQWDLLQADTTSPSIDSVTFYDNGGTGSILPIQNGATLYGKGGQEFMTADMTISDTQAPEVYSKVFGKPSSQTYWSEGESWKYGGRIYFNADNDNSVEVRLEASDYASEGNTTTQYAKFGIQKN